MTEPNDMNWWAEAGRLVAFILSIMGINKIMLSGVKKRVTSIEEKPAVRTIADCGSLMSNCPVNLKLQNYNKIFDVRMEAYNAGIREIKKSIEKQQESMTKWLIRVEEKIDRIHNQ